MSQPSTLAAARGSRAGFVLVLPALLALLAPSLPAQQPAAEPKADASERSATAARPTPNADNESDDSDRRPSNRKSVTHALDGAEIRLAFGVPKTGGREYAEMESLADGKVVRFFDSAAIKLSTPADLMFGETRIRAANVAPQYPGVYSLWLQRSGDGWRLLFNDKADVWGTQHDAAADVASTPLQYDEVDGLTLGFEGSLKPSAQTDGSVLLVFHWGKHRWTAMFGAAP